jgi:ribosomal protein S18 acetylase RimI-like enzyme
MEAMRVRRGTTDEMKALWNHSHSPTYEYFVQGLNRENIEFWTLEDQKENKLVGELYIFYKSQDLDEANGTSRAYLCAFRIQKSHQGLGLGSKLMNQVFERIKEKGFSEVTIGIDNDNYDRLKKMYGGWGFTELIKSQHYDYHYLDSNHQPVYYEKTSDLFLKKL